MPPDAAELWLRSHDPNYAESRKAWKDLDGTPGQEIPWGLEDDFAILLNAGYDYVEPVSERACDLCGCVFTPRETKQRFCSPRHRETAKKRRQRGCPPSS